MVLFAVSTGCYKFWLPIEILFQPRGNHGKYRRVIKGNNRVCGLLIDNSDGFNSGGSAAHRYEAIDFLN